MGGEKKLAILTHYGTMDLDNDIRGRIICFSNSGRVSVKFLFLQVFYKAELEPFNINHSKGNTL
jgi:hypothetical protein